jgi:uncharacterized protein (UPF0264 family)
MIAAARQAPGQAPSLLVSVRSPEEAEAALAGGAGVIDVKEPARGALGRAAPQTVAAVLDLVGARRPVSAALGELTDEPPRVQDPRLAFVKWGLAGCGISSERWQVRLGAEVARAGAPQTVVVAYADWQCARAPSVTDVVAFACRRPGNVLLIDTCCKDPGTLSRARPTLLDWLSPAEVVAVCEKCRGAGVRIALAGSLTLAEIKRLRGARPDWFAVRGAVCDEGDRRGAVQAERVRRLADYLTGA